MLYINRDFRVVKKEFDWGSLKGISLGESGRGRKEVFIPVPNYFEEGNIISSGLIKELSIGFSKANKPKIINSIDNEIYLILSSVWGYTRSNNGVIYKIFNEKKNCIETPLAKGNTADGDAGRIGWSDEILIKAEAGEIYEVVWGGGYRYDKDPTYYFVNNNGIDKVDWSNLSTYFEVKDIIPSEYFQKVMSNE